jgi:hypothetical protein
MTWSFPSRRYPQTKETAGPSTPLRSGRDDKGKGSGLIESGYRTEVMAQQLAEIHAIADSPA